MEKKQISPELSQAEPPPAEEEPVPADPPSRKRQLDGDDDDDDAAAAAAEPQAKRARPTAEPARLTQKNLALFDEMGGSKKKSSASSRRDSTDGSSATKTLSTTASGFAVQARENGVLDPLDSQPPENLDDIRRRLAESRATASPTESAYEDYVRAVGEAPNEATVVGEMLPLLKRYPKGYKRALNQAFTAFPRDVGFNNGLAAPQPDYVEGLGMEQFRPLPVDKHVDGAVLYRDNPRSVTLPHLAGEWKGPGGDMREATLQSGYDGAALVYARSRALAYQGTSDPAGHASITTFATNGAQLHLYAHYAAPSEDGALEYHQFPVKSASLVDSHAEHKEARKLLRNAQDHARGRCYELRDGLKDSYKKQRGSSGGSLHPVAAGAPSLPVPSGEPPHAHGDEDDFEVVEHQPSHPPTPPTSSKHQSSKTHSHHSHRSHSTPTSSSKASPSTHHSARGSGHKRKPPSSPGSPCGSSHHSRHKSYWKEDATSGRHRHEHSDGTVSWLDNEEDERA
ncbi:hypothetical protein VTK73DRAFT_1100 [Phialemonium thermophilum]|uniref:DUF7924 domain-containing protein n=1 Tax=Phialemonium thermophilum TaxID=223376 RepID=A0ABR3VTW4_9PEZI